MSALWMVAATWMLVALVLAMVIGRAVRIADDTEVLAALNFVVEGDPLEAPVPGTVVGTGFSAPPARWNR